MNENVMLMMQSNEEAQVGYMKKSRVRILGYDTTQ